MENNKNLKLAILSGKGGVGKSMLTSALAVLFASPPDQNFGGGGKNKKVVAVDCDADTPNLGIWLGGIKKWDKTLPVIASARPEINYKKCDGCGLCAKNCRFSAIKMIYPVKSSLREAFAKGEQFNGVNGKPVVNPFLCEGCGACEVICPKGAIKLNPIQNGEIRIKKNEHGFPLISGQLFPGETGSGKVVAEIKKEAEKFDYDIMLLDSAPGTGCPVIASLQGADFAVLITEPTLSGFTDLKRVLEVVEHFNIPWGLVVNKWDINFKLSNKMRKWAGSKFLGKISYDKEVFKAIANLTPIMETNLKAKKEIKAVYDKLLKGLSKP